MFLPCGPNFSLSYHLSMRLSSASAGLGARCARTFTPEASVFLPRRDSYANIRPLMSGGGSANRLMRLRIAANKFRVTAST